MALGLVAVAVLVWLFGLSWWIAIVVALAIACPAAAAWILLGRYDEWPKLPGIER
jgi:hypothetical protein